MYRLLSIFIGLLLMLEAGGYDVYAQQDEDKFELEVMGLFPNGRGRTNRLDSGEITDYATKILARLYQKGYWMATLDTMICQNGIASLHFYKGQLFQQVIVSLDDTFPLTFQNRVSQILTKNKKIKPNQIHQKINEAIRFFQSKGYPFATIQVASYAFTNQSIQILLTLDLGMKITFDSLEINNTLLKKGFISKYLGIKYGQDYNQKIVDRIDDNIQHIPFVILKNAKVTFGLKKGKVSLALNQQKANQFDVMLGATSLPNSSLEWTGRIDVKLHNFFRSAKMIHLHWENIQSQVQEMEVDYYHPLFLGSPLDARFSFYQLKQDSSFSNRKLSLSFDYNMVKTSSISLFYQNVLSNALRSNSIQFGSFQIHKYGLSMSFFFMDNRQYPHSGWRADISSSVGAKKNLGHPNTQSTQYNVHLDFKSLLPFSKQFTGAFRVQSGLLFNNDLYMNDLFRLGGLNSIRGFNDKSWFASQFMVANLECRYYLDKKTYFMIYYDRGILYSSLSINSQAQQPSGIGVGVELSTKRGQMKVVYGLGNSNDQGFSFDQSKIHFGYHALF